jgi:hypothetical protein
MPVILNASTSTGFVQSADTSGIVQIQSNGTTELTVTSTGVTVADNLLFNSGYGSAVIGYGCRAWVNFNGTGTVAIRASGNVSSITDNGTGSYTLNFTTALPDANYSVVALAQDSSTKMIATGNPDNIAPTTSAYRLVTSSGGAGTAQLDSTYVFVSVFR